MEKISTPRVALLPRAANLATLAVVVAATWWSGAQRPVGQAMLANAVPADTAAQRQQSALASTPTPTSTAGAIINAGHNTTATWPAEAATTLAREGLQVVGYQTRAHR